MSIGSWVLCGSSICIFITIFATAEGDSGLVMGLGGAGGIWPETYLFMSSLGSDLFYFVCVKFNMQKQKWVHNFGSELAVEAHSPHWVQLHNFVLRSEFKRNIFSLCIVAAGCTQHGFTCFLWCHVTSSPFRRNSFSTLKWLCMFSLKQ